MPAIVVEPRNVPTTLKVVVGHKHAAQRLVHPSVALVVLARAHTDPIWLTVNAFDASAANPIYGHAATKNGASKEQKYPP